MISKKRSTAWGCSLSGNMALMGTAIDPTACTAELPPLPVLDDDIFLSEEVLERCRNKPVGQTLKESLEYNKTLPHRTSLQEMYMEEQSHIADPLDQVGTKPDIEVRWKL